MSKLVRIFIGGCLLLGLVISPISAAAQYDYLSPEKINAKIKDISGKNKDISKLHTLAVTPGGRDVILLELGQKKGNNRAILVVANMEADYPISSEAALKLADNLTTEWKDNLDNYTWYIVACANPDGYANYFSTPLYTNFGNAKKVNNDNDDAVDEDGPDDLNKDGFVTMMRYKHPEGLWITVEDNPFLMKLADSEKGETGLYRMKQEGLDNDGDGEINEDGFGGVNPGLNFPHRFKHYTGTNGLWAASEEESRGLLTFAFDHPEIAMVVVLGRNNTLAEVPPSNNKSKATKDKYKLPGWMARNLGIDPKQEFPISELVEMGREFTGNPNLDEDTILRFLNVGAAVNPNKRDLIYWEKITEEYNEFMEEASLDGKRLSSPEFSPGSVAEWAYYQYGVPTFCMDFWTLPEPEKKEEEKDSLALTPEKIENMTTEEFLALGEEKIDEFLKSSGAPSQYSAKMIMSALEGGMMTTKRMAKMMKKMKKEDDSGGVDETDETLFAMRPEAFLEWKEYQHPTLGTVEIGGMVPYSTVTPPADKVDELIDKQIPFLIKLTEKLPAITISNVEVEKKASGVYKIDAWVTNSGLMPYPTYQGKRCQGPTPMIVTISGKSLKFLEGKERIVIPILGGSGGVKKLSWLINGKDGGKVELKISGPSIGSHTQSVTLKGGAK
ncbi:MAG: hypothetical protein KAR42_12690 [candidate division Zixibacteria bacterium]|nr:hypothetical protein [candidate division Zixibacteria bacterium]